MKAHNRLVAVFGLIMLQAGASACAGGGDSTAPPRGSIAAVTLTPRSATIGVGSSAPFDAVIIGVDGDTLRTAGVAWSSSDVDIARVSSAGVVTAVAVGTATIAATVQGRSATANVSVVPTAVASVQLTPLELQLAEGASGTVTVRVLDAQGRVLGGRAVQWRSSNSAVATVSSSGSVTGVGAGSTTIIATSEGRSASMAVTVSPVAVASVVVSPTSASVTVGGSRQFTADVRDASGAVLPGRAVVWSTNTPSIVSVSSTGMVVGVAPGTAQVTASSGGRSASASVTVEALPAPVVVGRVTVSPATATLKSSGTSDRSVQLDADAFRRASNGEWVLIPAATFTWSTSNSNIATVNANGLVTALAPGRVTIIATSGSQVGTAEITVEAPPPPPIVVARVTASPSTATLKASGTAERTVRITATAYRRNENGDLVAIPDAAFAWSSSNAAVALVGSDGLVTGLSAGSATITVTSGGESATVPITVEEPAPPPIAVGRVTVSPSTADIRYQGPIYRIVQLTASAFRRENDEWVLVPNATFVWSSSNPAVATVSSTGLVRGESEGVVTITATSGSHTGSARIEVRRR